MASNNETVAMVLLDFEHLITLGNIGPTVAMDIKRRIQSSHQREVGELCGERNGILNDNASLAADNYRLRREISELRECLREAVTEVCNRLEKCGFKEPCVFKTCYVQKWRKALQDEGGEK